MKSFIASHLFFQFLSIALLTGCVSPGSGLFSSVGHYEGSLTTQTLGKYQQISVKTDIAPSDSKGGSKIIVQAEDGTEQLTLDLLEVTGNTFTLKSSLALTRAVALHLNKDKSGDCYVSEERNSPVSLCLAKPQISLEIQDASGSSVLSLDLYRFNPEPTAHQETPQKFTLTQAISRARLMSFTSRIEFEHVLQAKITARAAYLHLFPQITINTVANCLTPSVSGALSALGDLAPFLLPSRWIAAHQAGELSRAELDADKLMRLDMGVQLEGMFYLFERDRLTLKFFETTLEKAISVRNEVKIREDLGQLQAGSTDNVNSMVNQLQQSILVMSDVLEDDQASLSQALGFFSPKAVSEMQIDQELIPIEAAVKYDFEYVSDTAEKRSFELDQMDNLITAAHDAKTMKYFTWLDPAGDPNLGLGAALSSQVQVSNSRIRELGITRGYLKAVISQKAGSAVGTYQRALEAYSLTNEGVLIQERLLKQALANLEAGTHIDFFELVQIFQNGITAQVQRETAVANYRVARSMVDRLLLQGYYANF